jgi:hypothetical protein
MRFMMIMYPGPDAESGKFTDPKLFADMGKFNEEMVKAGVMLAGEGLQPSSKGARVRFSGGKPKVVDGPFTETKEIIGGYWMIQTKSREEAIEWAKRCPAQNEMIEIRQVYEFTDFPPEFQKAAGNEPALREQLERSKKG